MKTRIVIGVLTLAFLLSGAIAQAQDSVLPTPPVASSSAPQASESVPSLDEQMQVEKINGVDPALLAERVKYRQKELAEGGYKWVPWTKVGKKVQDLILARKPDIIDTTDNIGYIDVAIDDVNKNGQPDFIVNFWEEEMRCGSRGCAYYVIFDNPLTPIAMFIGHSLRTREDGLYLDGKYVDY